MFYILILYLSDEFGFDDKAAGWVFGLLGMLSSIYGFLCGFVIDKLGVRRSLMLGSFLLLVSRLVLSFSDSHFMLLFQISTLLPVGISLGIPVMYIGIRRYTDE